MRFLRREYSVRDLFAALLVLLLVVAAILSPVYAGMSISPGTPPHTHTDANTGGSSLSAATGATKVLIQRQLASGSAQIDFAISGGYETYIFELADVYPAVGSSRLQMLISINSGSSYASGASDYLYAGRGLDQAGNGCDNNSAGATSLALDACETVRSDSAYGYSGTIRLTTPNQTERRKKITFLSTYRGGVSSRIIHYSGGGIYDGGNSAITNVRFRFDTQNIDSGIFTLYGVKSQ